MIRATGHNGKNTINVEGWPVIGRGFARLLGIVGLATLLANGTVACTSTSDEGEAEEEVVDEEGGNENAAVAEEGGNEAAAGDATAESGEAVENVATNVAAEAPVEEAPVDTAAIDPAANATVTDTMGADALPPVETAATDASAAPADEAPAAVAPAVPAATGPGLPAGTNAVVYVGGERATIYDAPNGREIGRMVRGDFVLAAAEGEWAKTSDGRYLRSAELQVAPVGRKKVQSRWRSPRSN